MESHLLTASHGGGIGKKGGKEEGKKREGGKREEGGGEETGERKTAFLCLFFCFLSIILK